MHTYGVTGRARRGGGAHRPGARLDGGLRGVRLLRGARGRARGRCAGCSRCRGWSPATSPRWCRPCPRRSRSTRESYSLRVIADASTLDQVRDAVARGRRHHGRGAADYVETDRLSGMSYNHPVWFLQRGAPGPDVVPHGDRGRGDPRRPRRRPRGLRRARCTCTWSCSPAGRGRWSWPRTARSRRCWRGSPRMEAIGMGVHSPHQWYVDRNVALAIETARRTDPKGLLNPGKLTATAARRLAGEHRGAPDELRRPHLARGGGAAARHRRRPAAGLDRAARPAPAVVHRLRDRVGDRRGRGGCRHGRACGAAARALPTRSPTSTTRSRARSGCPGTR